MWFRLDHRGMKGGDGKGMGGVTRSGYPEASFLLKHDDGGPRLTNRDHGGRLNVEWGGT